MSRFYAPKENVRGELIYIDGREAKHILNSMRLKINDKVVVFDGSGKEYVGFIKDAKRTSLVVKVVKERIPPKEELPDITLAQAIPKKEKMGYIIEKSTELGIKTIMPIISQRTIVKTDDKRRLSTKMRRWQKIAREASKQCGRNDVPEVTEIRKFSDLAGQLSDYDITILACLSDETMPLKKAVRDLRRGRIIVFIGPEGDFTPEEIRSIKQNKSCKLVSLGKRVLKSDTAGLYILSCLNYEFSS